MFKLFSGSLFQRTAPVDPGMNMPSCEFKPEPYEVKITFLFCFKDNKLREIHEDDVNCGSTNFQSRYDQGIERR